MRTLSVAFLLCCVTACGSPRAAPWMPSLIVTAGLRRAHAPGRALDAWRAQVALRWSLGRPRPIAEPAPVVKPPAAYIGLPCASPAICLWERRARGRALRRSR